MMRSHSLAFLVVGATLGYALHRPEPVVIAAPPAPAAPRVVPVVVRPDPVADPVAVPVPAPVPAPDPAPASETGELQGTITDPETSAPLVGATIIASSKLDGGHTHTAITDEHGEYHLADLPPAAYHIDIFYADRTTARDGVGVGTLDPTTLDVSLAP